MAVLIVIASGTGAVVKYIFTGFLASLERGMQTPALAGQGKMSLCV